MLAVNMRKAGVAKRLASENKMELKKTQKKSLMVHSSIRDSFESEVQPITAIII